MQRIGFNKAMALLLLSVLLAPGAAAAKVVDLASLKYILIPIHATQIVMAALICFMAVKLYRLTKPVYLFYLFYFAIVMFILNPFAYLQLLLLASENTSTAHVYHIVGQLGLIGMLTAFVILFKSIRSKMSA